MYVSGTVSAASTTTAGPRPDPHMTFSFSISDPSELSIDECGCDDDTMMDGPDDVVTNPFAIISIGIGRLERDGAMIVDGDDEVIITSLYDADDDVT